MAKYTLDVRDDYTPPEGEITSNAEYLNYVMHHVFESYKKQHNTQTFVEGITAARELYNSALEPNT